MKHTSLSSYIKQAQDLILTKHEKDGFSLKGDGDEKALLGVRDHRSVSEMCVEADRECFPG